MWKWIRLEWRKNQIGKYIRNAVIVAAALGVFLYGVLLAGTGFFTPAFPIDFDMMDPGFYVQAAAKSAVTVSMGFIALYVGLLMKSSRATILASFLLIFLTQANIGDFSMAGNHVMPMFLAAVSLVCAGLSVCGVERRDLR